jgi:hypothetical protein
MRALFLYFFSYIVYFLTLYEKNGDGRYFCIELGMKLNTFGNILTSTYRKISSFLFGNSKYSSYICTKKKFFV